MAIDSCKSFCFRSYFQFFKAIIAITYFQFVQQKKKKKTMLIYKKKVQYRARWGWNNWLKLFIYWWTNILCSLLDLNENF